MSAQVVAAYTSQSGGISTGISPAPAAGDVLVWIGQAISVANTAVLSISGGGLTWTKVASGSRTAVFVGEGVVTASTTFTTAGASSHGLWHLRGQNGVAVTLWEYFGAQNSPAVNPSTSPTFTLTPPQVALALARRADNLDGGGNVGTWSAAGGSLSLTRAKSATTATAGPFASSATFTTSIGNERVHAVVVVGSPPPPDPPTDLVATPSTTSVALAWTAVAGATGYTVAVDGGTPVDVGAVTAHLVDGLAPVTGYTFTVRAYSSNGTSAGTSVAATTLAAPDPDKRWWTHRLAAAVGLDPEAAQPVIEVATWSGSSWTVDPDLSNALAGYQITYGRSDARDDVDPIRATLTLATARVPATPAIATRLRVQICQPVATALGLVGDDRVRFTGEVTDPLVDHGARLTKLVCVGRLGRTYRQPVAATGWPAENDGDRIARILASTGIDLPVGVIDAGTVQLAAAVKDDTTARLVELVTASATGQLVEQPSGAVDWHGPEHRRGAVPQVTLAAAAVFRAITWAQRLADLVNQVTVKLAGGEQVTVTMPWSADPVDGYGPYPASVDTALTTELDARTLAARIVARHFVPSWQLPDLQVDLLRTVPLVDLPAVLRLRHGDRLQLDGLPAGCPVPPRVFLEGWTETATPRSWRWSASVSDPIQSGVAVRWIDVPTTGARTWADVKPGLTWLDALRIEDPDDLFT